MRSHKRHLLSMFDLPQLAGTYVGIASPPTRRIAEFHKCGRLNLNSELSGVVTYTVHRLVDAIPSPLEGGALRPLVDNVIPHRDPNIGDVGASVHPGGSGVRCHCRV